MNKELLSDKNNNKIELLMKAAKSLFCFEDHQEDNQI